jgi:GDP-L-fucose synthase
MSEMCDKHARIYVAGHRGLAGSAIVRSLQKHGHTNILTRTHTEFDLIDQRAVGEFFAKEKPDYVVLAAAKVGGILANNTYPADFIYRNLAIQTNVIHEAWKSGVKRLLFLGSSCIYPRDCPQPIKEEYLLTGPLEETNKAYAITKIAGIEMCASYNKQYGTQFLCAMPTNLYGPGDNYDLNTSHVLPALMRKAITAKNENLPSMIVWGTGTPRREFLYSDDLGDACTTLLSLPWEKVSGAFPTPTLPLINVGYGEDLTIRELAEAIASAVGFIGAIEWDRTKLEGTPRKLMDSSRIRALGWMPRTTLHAGLQTIATLVE